MNGRAAFRSGARIVGAALAVIACAFLWAEYRDHRVYLEAKEFCEGVDEGESVASIRELVARTPNARIDRTNPGRMTVAFDLARCDLMISNGLYIGNGKAYSVD